MSENPNDTEATKSENKVSLGKAAGRGFSWMSFSLVLGKVLIFFAQIVLGWILTEEDFGVLAIVASFIAFVRIFQDGGLSQVLVQRGKTEFDALQGIGFWLVAAISTGAGLALMIAAPIIARIYGDARLTNLLFVLALTLPLGAPATFMRATLQLNLQFRIISIIVAVRFAIRSIGMILLAWIGFGAMSFVLPLLFTGIFDNVATYLYTRAKPWNAHVAWKEWRALVADSSWVVFTAIFRGLARNGDYLVLGLMIPTELVGLYFFGYQLTIQFTWLLALNLRHVFFPILSQLADQPARQAAAITRTLRMLMLVMAPINTALAVTIGPLEQLIWHQKWASAVPLMQIFAIISPILILSDVVSAALASRGQFRLGGILTCAEGVWLLFSAWLAVMIAGTEDITLIAFWIFGLQAAFLLTESALVLQTFNIRTLTFLNSFLPQWTIAMVAGGLTAIVGHFLPTGTLPLVQILVLGTVYTIVFLLLAMWLLRSDLNDLARVAPKPVARILKKVFFLPTLEVRQ
ncbi:oligosaccharide flippase family protein [Bythopirellula goksoeyrii]|uniref:Teichuronic acid biosynthesis protein TuaB n=1 Tax=Bythopirellula goksoeyrii TaxID=1400387 RepID=A0A5B9QKQ3_9BACT|nr:oligosaccharide flippase family protein [Bythopirellula goksoeyrii]QEG34711.1 Teichuronic acid biosynthesis protein TuaB [Bythopirellula goksoeyrii]